LHPHGTPWIAVADDSRRQVLLLKDGERTPTGTASSFRFTLPALSTHLRVLRDAGSVSEREAGRNRFYSIKREKMSEMTRFSGMFWGEGMRESREATRR
jgi:ArsR family transcriptional regulator, arsenate/arsenite/antimonite-responsive transcriptional repressor